MVCWLFLVYTADNVLLLTCAVADAAVVFADVVKRCHCNAEMLYNADVSQR